MAVWIVQMFKNGFFDLVKDNLDIGVRTDCLGPFLTNRFFKQWIQILPLGGHFWWRIRDAISYIEAAADDDDADAADDDDDDADDADAADDDDDASLGLPSIFSKICCWTSPP